MSDTRIKEIRGRAVWDSRARPAVEAEVTLAGGEVGRAIAPAGASRGRHEAVDLRDGGSAFAGFGVGRALGHINAEIRAVLCGLDAADQGLIDHTLIDLDGTADKSRLGGNATVAVSMAALKAAANAAAEPLWRYLCDGAQARIPIPEIQIFGGGAHAGKRVDIQDFLIMAPRAESFRHALEMTAEVYLHAGQLMAESGRLAGTADEGGWWPNFDSNEQALEMLVSAIERAHLIPGDDIAISLDVAASEFFMDGQYRLGLEQRELDTDGLLEMLVRWTEQYPILSIEDPVAEDDSAGMAAITAAIGSRVQIIGDDFLVTNAARVTSAIAQHAGNAVLLKVNQAGTITETRAALEVARAAGWGTVVSARSGESEDVTIAHLAVGWNAGQFKVGSIARGERTAKWNEMLRIEEAMGNHAEFAGVGALPMNAG
jgi:enolase